MNTSSARNHFCIAGFISLALLGGLLVACGESSPTSPTPTASSAPEDNERKVDSILLDLLLQYRVNGKDAALKFARERGILDSQNNVLFTLALDSPGSVPAVSRKLRDMGATVRGVYNNLISASVPLDSLVSYVTQDEKRANFFRDLSDFSSVREIRLAPPPGQG